MLIAIIRGVDLGPIVGLLLNWMIGSAFGAGVVVMASRNTDRRALGRRMIETVAALCARLASARDRGSGLTKPGQIGASQLISSVGRTSR
jgi:hypothetical protein